MSMCFKIASIILLVSSIVDGKKGVPNPPKLPKPLKICGTSQCDSDMMTPNGNIGGWHVPDLNNLPVTAWANNNVNYGKLVTSNLGLTSVVKYGGFCSGGQKTVYFKGSTALALPDPSWIATIPATDLDVAGDLKAGFTYKLDVKASDLTLMNQVASVCQAQCKSTLGCNFVHYGWEQPAGWFCKFYSANICNAQESWWKPAPPALSVSVLGGAITEAIGVSGGCRVTDTISQDTSLLTIGSLAIASTVPYTAALPYLIPTSYTRVDGNVASIKCDATAGALTPGWPTFGTIWI